MHAADFKYSVDSPGFSQTWNMAYSWRKEREYAEGVKGKERGDKNWKVKHHQTNFS